MTAATSHRIENLPSSPFRGGLGLAAGVMGMNGLRVGGDNPALPVTAREQTLLCSFRTLGLCSP